MSVRKRHDIFYKRDGSCVFAVGDYLYNIHASTLTDLSDIFEHIYSLPQGTTLEGKSDEYPFVLAGIESKDFNHLLEFLYHKRDYDDIEPLEYLLSILKLSTMWNIGVGRRFAIRRLSSRADFDPSLKLCLAQKYNVEEWIGPAFKQLMERDINVFTDEEVNLMGATIFRILTRTIIRIEAMRLCIAYTPPEVIHSPMCGDNAECQRVWEIEWWGGFCRHFLHPDKVCTFQASIITLETAKIHNMCADCFNSTVIAIKATDILDFCNNLADDAINEINEILQQHCDNKIVKPGPESIEKDPESVVDSVTVDVE